MTNTAKHHQFIYGPERLPSDPGKCERCGLAKSNAVHRNAAPETYATTTRDGQRVNVTLKKGKK